MRTGGLAHAAHGAPARAAETGARRRGPVRDSAPLKSGGRWTRVGTDPDAGPAPLGGAGKSAGRRRSRLPRRAAEAVRAARSKPSSAAVAGPRVLLAYAEHLPRAGRARGRGEATAGRRGPARGPRPARAANLNVGKSRAAEDRSKSTDEASGDARRRRQKNMARRPPQLLGSSEPWCVSRPARRGRQGRGRGRWPRRPAVAPGRRSQGRRVQPSPAAPRRSRPWRGPRASGRSPAPRCSPGCRAPPLPRASRPGSPRTFAPPPWTRRRPAEPW